MTRTPVGAAPPAIPWTLVVAVVELAAAGGLAWFGMREGWSTWELVSAVGAVVVVGGVVLMRVSASAGSGRLRPK